MSYPQLFFGTCTVLNFAYRYMEIQSPREATKFRSAREEFNV